RRSPPARARSTPSRRNKGVRRRAGSVSDRRLRPRRGVTSGRSRSRLAFEAGESRAVDKRKILIQLDSDPQPSVFDRVVAIDADATAAAAVRVAAKHLSLKDAPALVLGGTGPVGQRVARLLAREGADVWVASRQASRAEGVCRAIAARVPGARLRPVGTAAPA